MRPLTDHTPKPLLEVRGKALAQWHLDALARAGVARIVINTAWLDTQFEPRFGSVHGPSGDQQSAAMQLRYSHEGRDFGHALETAGGIVRALPSLCEDLTGDAIFWVLAGDGFVPGFSFDPQAVQDFAASGMLAHLWLVPNPAHNAKGDFGLAPPANSLAPAMATNPSPEQPGPSYTYSTIGLYRASLFAMPWCPIATGNPSGLKAPLAPLLRAAIAQGRVSASLYTGLWADVGTPERLAVLHSFPDTNPNHL